MEKQGTEGTLAHSQSLSGGAKKADYVFSVSWEVCNKVGGIYTVLSTQAKEFGKLYPQRLVYVGPDLGQDVGELRGENVQLWQEWKAVVPSNVPVRMGEWAVPGRPMAILVDWRALYEEKNAVYGKMWELYGVDSIRACDNYDEASMFGLAAGRVVAAIVKNCLVGKNVVLQAHEWMSAFALFEAKAQGVGIRTIFTTHATSIGRSITSNNKKLYAYFNGYFGDQMARELHMEAKHSAEKCAALQCDCMTTVSEVTDRECRQFLGRGSDVLLPNGFEEDFVPKGRAFTERARVSRRRTIAAANAQGGSVFGEDALIVCTSGRNDFRCKGYDVVLSALGILKEKKLKRDILMVIAVPYWGQWVGALSDERNEHFKLLVVPKYLDGKDGVVDMEYYDWLCGIDLALYPSYYEPWGYTPLETAAFGIPTVTTDLAGFGRWVEGLGGEARSLENGVEVLHRTDDNYDEIARAIADDTVWLSQQPARAVNRMRKNAKQIAAGADWKRFIKYYEQALSFALNHK